MRKCILFSLILIAVVCATPGYAQKRRNRPPKGENVQTVENAVENKKAQRDAKMEEYKASQEHLRKIQDKATRKRMKKNMKHSQRQFMGKDLPWYKRIFRKKKN